MMSLRTRLASFLALFLITASATWGTASAQPLASTIDTPRVHAELLAYAPEGVTPGAPLWAGLRITHQPEWHTYWKNPGDSGLPTELRWTLPAGISAGDIVWPAPKKIPIGTLANYGYDGTMLLPVPLTISPSFTPSPLANNSIEIELRASWLVCRKECIPEEAHLALKLPRQGSSAMHKAAFDAALAAAPVPLTTPSRIDVTGQTLHVRIEGLPAMVRGRMLELFPETGDVIHTAAVAGKDWTQAWQDDVWTATVPLAPLRSASPPVMPLVLTLADGNAATPALAWRTQAPVHGTWPASAAPIPTGISPTLEAALTANAAAAEAAPPATSGFAIALAGALIGGLLLNLMPCVFPVLAIKVLGFARHAGDRSGHRKAGLAYTAGVLLSFLALGGALVALRAAGAQLGWGFQLQSPAVVAALAALFTLIGLNLAGVFEFMNLAPQALAGLQLKHPRANDFLSGVLAVVVASPCTAPFMGASLGLTIGLPAAQTLLLFAVLGLGLALPYLLAGFVPAVARLLPRPGLWMETLRRLLAFPMFATVAWLVWVLGQQSGIDGAGALLALLVCLASVAWSLTLHGRARWIITALLLACTALITGTIGSSILHENTPTSTAAADHERWQPWSAERALALAAKGRTVFTDYTAAWCVTCQFNKKTTLSDAQVLAAFDTRNIALLRADWTRRDAAITAALAALGRNGVPVYVLQAPGKAPVVLTEILSPREVLSALEAP